jgi:hypothetical protein
MEACHVELELSLRQASRQAGPDNLFCIAKGHERADELWPALVTLLDSDEESPPRIVNSLLSSGHALSLERVLRLLVKSLASYADCSIMPSTLENWANESIEDLLCGSTVPFTPMSKQRAANIRDFFGRHVSSVDSAGAQWTSTGAQNNAAVKETLRRLHRSPTSSERSICKHARSRIALCLSLWNANPWVCGDVEYVHSLLSELCWHFQMKLPESAWTSEPLSHEDFVVTWLGDMRILRTAVCSWVRSMILIPHRRIDEVLPFANVQNGTQKMSLYAAHPHLHAAVNEIMHSALLRTGDPAVLRLIVHLNSDSFLSSMVNYQVGSPRSDWTQLFAAPAILKPVIEEITSCTAPSLVFASIDKARRTGPDTAMQAWLLAVKFPMLEIEAVFSLCGLAKYSLAAVDFLVWVWTPIDRGGASQQLRSSLVEVRNEFASQRDVALTNLAGQFETLRVFGGASPLVCMVVSVAIHDTSSKNICLQTEWEVHVSSISKRGAFRDTAWAFTETLGALDALKDWLRLRGCGLLESTRERRMTCILSAAFRLFVSDLRCMKSKFPEQAAYFAAVSLRALRSLASHEGNGRSWS